MEYINEIFSIDEIFDIENNFTKKRNIPLTNVSHWNSSKDFQEEMAKVLEIPNSALPWNYSYTYSISQSDRQELLKRLGVIQDKQKPAMALLVQSSTIAIVNLVNLLKHIGSRKICILNPTYFSIASCLMSFQLDYAFEYIEIIDETPRIPVEKIITEGYDAVWLTSPLFCTGVSFSDEQKLCILQLIEKKIILITDESMAFTGNELVRSLSPSPYLFSIYSPHKSIAINALKFSAIVCHEIYEDFLEQWVDVFAGALPQSTHNAILHYLSDNYVECEKTYSRYVNNSITKLSEVFTQFKDIEVLHEPPSHYATIVYRGIDLKQSSTSEFIEKIINNSFASLLPGRLTGLDSYYGFTFRINLTHEISELSACVFRILSYLRNQANCHN